MIPAETKSPQLRGSLFLYVTNSGLLPLLKAGWKIILLEPLNHPGNFTCPQHTSQCFLLSAGGRCMLSPQHSSKVFTFVLFNQDVKKSRSRHWAFPGLSKTCCGSNAQKHLRRVYRCLDSPQKGFCKRRMLNYIVRMPCQHVIKIQTAENRAEGRTCRFKET